jgi:hypothetical protein
MVRQFVSVQDIDLDISICLFINIVIHMQLIRITQEVLV